MLYATTRNKTDTYTPHRALLENRAPDGGYFVPFRMPVVDVHKFENLSFSESVAEILNLFFSNSISAWDIECLVGKTPVKIITMPHRVVLVQLWNNPNGKYSYLCDKIYKSLCGKENFPLTDWAKIVIRIAVLFGICELLRKNGLENVDITVNTGDFSDPMAAWYARKMGLPIGTIICACNENGVAWDFIHRGELSTGTKETTNAAHPSGVERLIFENFGVSEVKKYLESASHKRMYQIRPDMLQIINQGMFVSVVGKERVESVISSVYRSNQCILDSYAALSYGSLQDYRAKTGESCATVILSENNPIQNMAMVKKATGLTKSELETIINQI